MRWLLIGLGCVAGLVLVVVLVGFLLPRSHVASRRVQLKQSAETVFAIVTDFAAGPSWRPTLKSAEMLPPREGKPSFREVGPDGSLTFVVDEMTAPTRLVTRIVDNAAFGGTWTFEVTAEPTGCSLAITERGEVYNPVFRFVSHFFLSQTATMDAYLDALAKKLASS